MTISRDTLKGLRRLANNVASLSRTRGISPRHQWREYRRIHSITGINRAEFYGYWLWDLDRPLTERLAFISNVERRAIEYRMNPREPSLLVRNKAVATSRLEDAGIAVSKVLGLLTVHYGVPATSDRYPFWSGDTAVTDLLRAPPGDGIVIKPERGGRGRSVHVFREASPNELVALDGTRWSLSRLRSVLETEQLWKIEKRMLQHPDLVELAGETLGTIRLVSYRTLDGQVHLTQAAWKAPIGLSGVDHFSHGAGQLVASINSDGRLGPPRRWFALSHVENHPVTAIPFAGATMPHWEEARQVAIRTAECFPELASLGYDIAITADGPVVIEVNPCWGERVTQAAIPRGLVQGTFAHFLRERGFGGVMNLTSQRLAN